MALDLQPSKTTPSHRATNTHQPLNNLSGLTARHPQRDPALGDRAIRHRLSSRPDDAANARCVRRVRARHHRRPRHQRHRAPRPGRTLAERTHPIRIRTQRAKATHPRRTHRTRHPAHLHPLRRRAAGCRCDRPAPRRRTRSRAAAWLAAQHRALGAQQRGIRRACSLARADVPRSARAADRSRHIRPRTSTTEAARRGLGDARGKPRRVPTHRPRALRALPPRIRRHVRQRQRRHLPLLRLLRPTKARTKKLRRRAHTPREARDRDPHTAHQHLPRRRAHPRRHRASGRER